MNFIKIVCFKKNNRR